MLPWVPHRRSRRRRCGIRDRVQGRSPFELPAAFSQIVRHPQSYFNNQIISSFLPVFHLTIDKLSIYLKPNNHQRDHTDCWVFLPYIGYFLYNLSTRFRQYAKVSHSLQVINRTAFPALCNGGSLLFFLAANGLRFILSGLSAECFSRHGFRHFFLFAWPDAGGCRRGSGRGFSRHFRFSTWTKNSALQECRAEFFRFLPVPDRKIIAGKR